MTKIEQCYADGKLKDGLEMASEFVVRIGDTYIDHIYTVYDEKYGWIVMIVYSRDRQ